jgi:hypothetical protein
MTANEQRIQRDLLLNIDTGLGSVSSRRKCQRVARTPRVAQTVTDTTRVVAVPGANPAVVMQICVLLVIGVSEKSHTGVCCHKLCSTLIAFSCIYSLLIYVSRLFC